MATIKIPREELREYGLPDDGYEGVEVIEDNVVDNSRWSIYHELIFRWHDGKTYRTDYSVGATEMQDESPWEYSEEVECTEVHKVPKTVEVWEAV
jgi:hypothetical protein